jgi:hypothetical protein
MVSAWRESRDISGGGARTTGKQAETTDKPTENNEKHEGAFILCRERKIEGKPPRRRTGDHEDLGVDPTASPIDAAECAAQF